MHVITIAGLWILIQVVPLIVMFVIYFFFAQQNFFQIEGLWKGIIASGPIAAYIFLTWIGFRYFKDLAATFDPQDDYRDLLGSWELVSQSEKKARRQLAAVKSHAPTSD
jgi:hypothetical protein